MKNKKNAFTLIELVSVLVILAILAVIITPLVFSLVNKVKVASNKRSVDAYGKAVELSVLSYLMDNGEYPEDLSLLNTEYKGKEVVCNVMKLIDGEVYLSECMVNNVEVKDPSTNDGWYHYGKLNTTAVKYILTKANEEKNTTYEVGSDASHEMYIFNHDITDQTEALTDYRYIGSDPYNYVTFNNELWRIIGVFTVEDEKGNKEQRIKIIRNESIGAYNWDSNWINEWSTASLNKYLNGDYYDSLTNESRDMIISSKYYLGGSDIYLELDAPSYYSFERGKKVPSNHSVSWVGKIALMYLSDYAYTYANGVDDICYTDIFDCASSTPASSWFFSSSYQWTLSPNSVNAQRVFCVRSTGYVTDNYCTVHGRYDVLPVLYLSSAVKIIDGDGSISNPYKLNL